MPWESIDFTAIVAAVALGIGVHLALAFLSLRWSILFLLAGMLLLLSPLSIAVYVPMLGLIKLAKIYVSLAIAVVAFPRAMRLGIGSAGKVTIGLGCFYFIGLLYSGQPVAGFQFKGLVLLNLMCGVLLGESVQSFRELASCLHVLLFASIVFVIGILVGIVAFNYSSGGTRIAPFGINANAVASAAAINMAICTYLALYDPDRWTRWIAMATAGLTAIIIVSTGSRTGVVSTVVVCGLILIPLVRRPGRFIFALLSIAVLGIVLSQFVDAQSSAHLFDVANTREGVWSAALDSFQTNILIGPGWASTLDAVSGTEPLNAHSIFLQMLAEMGLVGFFALLLTIALLFRAALIMRRNTINALGPTPIIYFDFALLASPILVGFFESGLLSSSSSQGVFFGFAAGLIDRFVTMTLVETQERQLLAVSAVPDEFDGAILPLELQYSDVGHGDYR